MKEGQDAIGGYFKYGAVTTDTTAAVRIIVQAPVGCRAIKVAIAALQQGRHRIGAIKRVPKGVLDRAK